MADLLEQAQGTMDQLFAIFKWMIMLVFAMTVIFPLLVIFLQDRDNITRVYLASKNLFTLVSWTIRDLTVCIAELLPSLCSLIARAAFDKPDDLFGYGHETHQDDVEVVTDLPELPQNKKQQCAGLTQAGTCKRETTKTPEDTDVWYCWQHQHQV